MKNILLFSSIVFALMGCEKDFSPLVNNGYVSYTGYSENNRYEFRITNISDETLWYWGYDENSPVYQYAIFTNNEWQLKGPGWCGTGLDLYVLNPSDSFLIKIIPPDDEHTWRAGVILYDSPESEGETKWSKGVR